MFSYLVSQAATPTATPSPVTPPQAESIWEYVILLIVSGGGVVVIQQLLSAYKTWSQVRGEKTTLVEVNRDTAVEKVVTLLQTQMDEQAEDYVRRLKEKDEYYQGELLRRSQINTDASVDKDEVIRQARAEVNRLRGLLRQYQVEFGYLENKEDPKKH